MMSREISIPELALVAGTRAAFGVGVGLLAAQRFRPETRQAVGWTLVAVGVITTIPLVADVVFQRKSPRSAACRGDKGPMKAEYCAPPEPAAHSD